jgi:hypothetical protein
MHTIPPRQWRSFRQALALLGMALCTSTATAAEQNCVIPSEDVVTAVMLRASPSTNAAVSGRLAPGERAELLGEVPYWYRVRLADGHAG